VVVRDLGRLAWCSFGAHRAVERVGPPFRPKIVCTAVIIDLTKVMHPAGAVTRGRAAWTAHVDPAGAKGGRGRSGRCGCRARGRWRAHSRESVLGARFLRGVQDGRTQRAAGGEGRGRGWGRGERGREGGKEERTAWTEREADSGEDAWGALGGGCMDRRRGRSLEEVCNGGPVAARTG